MKFSMQFKGLDKVIDQYEKIEKELQESLKKTVNDSVKNVVRNAKNMAPVDTGNLRRSIQR